MARRTANDEAFPSERRIVTALAVDIVGSMRHIAACDPDEAQAFFDRCFDYLGEAIERAGGSLVSYEGDGGVAAFGWPRPLEAHADAACLAAWEIQSGEAISGPDGRPVLFRVGVHSGLAAVRRIEVDGRSHFNAVGATIHIAAKLQQCAPGGSVLVSAEAARLARSRLTLAAHGAEPVLDELGARAFRLEARPEPADGDVAHRYRSPMVGRPAERAALSASLPRRGAKSRSVAVIGEAGIGKSRLAAAAVAEAGAMDVKSLVFFGDVQKRTTPFATARGLVADLIALQAEPPLEALAAAGVEPDDLAALETLLAPDRRRPPGPAARPTETQLARALVAGFCALALDRPAILLVEDLHVVDPESRHFLRLLAEARTRQPLCLVVTGRTEALEEAREIAHTVIRLDPLPRPAMRDLALQLWPAGRERPDVLELMLDRADGVPFVLEELIRSLDVGAEPAGQTLPTSVESMIHARLQRLSRRAKATAQAISLLGQEVSLDLAEAVAGLEPAALREDLAELERFAFIHPPVGGSAQMRHQIIAEACANTIPLDRRRRLHLTAVEAIRSRHPRLTGRFEQLAFHAEGAGADAMALEYLLQAAIEARRSSAAGSLNLIFDRAVGLMERIGEAADEIYLEFVLTAFASMVQLGEFDKARRHLPRTMALARRLDRPAQALSQAGMLGWFEGRYEEGLAATEEGLVIARALNSPALIYSCTIMQTNILHGMGRLSRAIAEQEALCELLTGELETARLGAAGIPRTAALAFLGWYILDTGDYERGLAIARQAFDLAVREGDAYSEALARNALGRSLMKLSRNHEAVECYAAARELCERDGYDAIKPHLAGRIAGALARTGRAREAIAIVEDCLKRSLHLRTGQLEAICLYTGYAEALVVDGQTERGLAVLAEALAMARRIRNPWLTAEALGLRAHLLAGLAPGDPRIAADRAEQADICAHFGLAPWPPAPAATLVSAAPL